MLLSNMIGRGCSLGQKRNLLKKLAKKNPFLPNSNHMTVYRSELCQRGTLNKPEDVQHLSIELANRLCLYQIRFEKFNWLFSSTIFSVKDHAYSCRLY